MMKNKTVTDRIFTSTDTFQVSDRVGDMTVYAYNDGSITVQIDKSREGLSLISRVMSFRRCLIGLRLRDL
jgi:hypothetical protein